MASYKTADFQKATPGQPGKALRFLYRTRPGRVVLRTAVKPLVSKTGGRLLNSRVSRVRIRSFIRKSGIDMSQYEQRKYSSFNDFFTRKIKNGARPVDMCSEHFISPCDAKLEVFPIQPDSRFNIKGSDYTISQLLDNKPLADNFNGGSCLVFRLAVDDYHRYCYIDDGVKGENIRIPGKFHTVQPIALEQCQVFAQNCREFTVMETKNFGTVVQIEVGALMVGRISNLHGCCSFARGQEKGMFEFGGSTIILLVKAGAIEIDNEILENSSNGLETIVKMGQSIGVKA